ncbi:MAG: oligosaccharide flippase family protein [Eubacteriales bacterium]|nr:oligosaccharide flippase family protein [Eubacteriales bacterium]
MSQKKLLLQGAVLLTLAGVIGRIISFFYRIFLSQIIGAEGVGVYQLIFPVYALAICLSSSGIQTCISREVSSRHALNDPRGARTFFLCGTCLSLACAFLVSAFLFFFHDLLAIRFVHEPRTAGLLYLLSPAIPFAALHACISGYYFGLKKTAIPAASQILENLLRFLTVFIIYRIALEKQRPITPTIAVYGLITEEIGAALFSLTAFVLYTFQNSCGLSIPGQRLFFPAPFRIAAFYHEYVSPLFCTAFPLTLSRVLVNLLQTLEAFLIPIQLQAGGMTSRASLSVYGVLTGMALPLLLFPTALSSSLATLLLPIVSELQAKKNTEALLRMIRKSCGACLAFGLLVFLFFFSFSRSLGLFLFHNTLAADFIRALSWSCPLIFLSPTLLAILNGLGKSSRVFLHNTASVLVRIGFILLAMPRFGISGFFYGLLVSQLLLFFLSLHTIRKTLSD